MRNSDGGMATLTKKAQRSRAGGAARAKDDEGPSLRSWIAALEKRGQLRRIRAEVDWDQEIAGIARINLGLGGPGLLFEAIKGYRKGRCTKFLTAALATAHRSACCSGSRRTARSERSSAI